LNRGSVGASEADFLYFPVPTPGRFCFHFCENSRIRRPVESRGGGICSCFIRRNWLKWLNSLAHSSRRALRVPDWKC